MVTVAQNVILFGATGAGKSSIVNMLLGSNAREKAKVSSGISGCTFDSKSYQVDIYGRTVNLFDTAGFDESDKGTVMRTDAIVKLYKLLTSLEDGVNLLVFCMRAYRVPASAPGNWTLFHDFICDKKVPIAIIITGLENENNMDGWWLENQDGFEKKGMTPIGHACITSIHGKQLQSGSYVYEREYEESKVKVMSLIRGAALIIPWKVPRPRWFRQVIRWLLSWLGIKIGFTEWAHTAMHTLVTKHGMSKEDASQLLEELAKI